MGDVVRSVDWSPKASQDQADWKALGDLTLGDVLKLASEHNAKPGGSGGGDDMNARITNLERDMTEVKVTLGKVETRLSHIETNMLTKGYAAILALGVTIAFVVAGWWVVQQYLAPLIKAIPK